jgi:hypothetical protein
MNSKERRSNMKKTDYYIIKSGDKVIIKRLGEAYSGIVINKRDNYKDALLCARVERMVLSKIQRERLKRDKQHIKENKEME